MDGASGGVGMQVTPRYERFGSAGTVRPSQLITTFGPGSLVQTRNDSVIVMGPDSWAKQEGRYKVIHHAYLEALLGKTHFRMPGAGGGGRAMVVACRSFPTWGVCSNPRCKALQRHRDAPARGRAGFRCDLCKKPLYPARFIVMCDRGHLDDFPWREWAHSQSKTRCDNPDPVLRMRAWGRSTALSDYYVRCDECGALRPCGMAVSHGGLDGIMDTCSGQSPWLCGPAGERAGAHGGGACPSKPRGIQTLSTSLYYPSTVSALYIPKMLHEIQRHIAEHKVAIDSLREMSSDREIAERHSIFAELRGRYGADAIAAHLGEWYRPTGAGGAPLTKASSEMDIRRAEYDDLTAHAEFRAGDHLEIASPPLGAEASGHLPSLRTVKRLTEIRVVRSFTRGVAPDPYSAEEAAEVHYCQIAHRSMKWYPAVENRGEGILFSLSEERLRRWEGRPDVAARCAATIEAVGQWDAEHGWRRQDAARPRYLLIHTVSHLLARELARRSGYAEASIRERLYCGDGYNGILLYTASPSSDGSLGGLARQGGPDAFWDALRSAVRRSIQCSGDPLCSDDDPSLREQNGMPVVARLNGSACYACALLPETSCENANRLLDRALVAGDSLGFFSGLV